MTIDVTIATGAKVFNAYGQPITGSQALDPSYAHSLIAAGLATANTPGQHPSPMNTPFDASGAANYCTTDGLHEGGTAPGYELNVGTGGTVTTLAGGTVAQTLRALFGTFT